MTLSEFQMTFSRGKSFPATTSQQFWSFYCSCRQQGLVFHKGFGGCQSAEPPGPLMGDTADRDGCGASFDWVTLGLVASKPKCHR